MEIVHVDDPGHAGEVGLQAADVETGRRGLDQDAHGARRETPGAGHDPDADRDGDDGVDRLPVRHGDDDTGDDDAERRHRVGEHVDVGALDVQALAGAAAQQRDRDDVHEQAQDGHHEHRPRLDRRLRIEAQHRLHEDVPGDHEEEDGVGERGEDLEPVQPERARPVAAGAVGEADRRQRHADADGVGEQVGGVRQERERPGEVRRDRLDDEEGRGEHEHDPEPPGVARPCPPRRRGVIVPVPIPVTVRHGLDGTSVGAAERGCDLAEVGVHEREVVGLVGALSLREALERAEHLGAQPSCVASKRLRDARRDRLLGEHGRDALVAGELRRARRGAPGRARRRATGRRRPLAGARSGSRGSRTPRAR